MSELKKQTTAMNPEEQNSPISTEPAIQSPPSENQPTPAFGWTPYAEKINGRFAMIGFIVLLLLQLFTRQDFFTWIGLP